jgi:glycosyltransferase involved in cell wall biosynthesis
MKVKIVFRFRAGPWGGGNQFLLALKDCLSAKGQLAEDMNEADIFLFDSFNDVELVLLAKRHCPKTPFVHRINGPISAYRGRGRHVDLLIYALTRYIADGVIFQSEYSREGNISLGMQCPEKSAVVHNAARPLFFQGRQTEAPREKTRIIATSWSSNINKGFDVLQYLDSSLDFSKYAMTFVGSSPVLFKNITMIPPQDASSLLDYLRNHDIYLAASKNESCSNAVLEALAVGLPVVALKSGGTPELVGAGGEYFDNAAGAIDAIDAVARDIKKYRDRIRRRSIDDACAEYVAFFEQVLDSPGAPKKLTVAGLMEIQSWRALRKTHLGVDKLNRAFGGVR